LPPAMLMGRETRDGDAGTLRGSCEEDSRLCNTSLTSHSVEQIWRTMRRSGASSGRKENADMPREP